MLKAVVMAQSNVFFSLEFLNVLTEFDWLYDKKRWRGSFVTLGVIVELFL